MLVLSTHRDPPWETAMPKIHWSKLSARESSVQKLCELYALSGYELFGEVPPSETLQTLQQTQWARTAQLSEESSTSLLGLADLSSEADHVG